MILEYTVDKNEMAGDICDRCEDREISQVNFVIEQDSHYSFNICKLCLLVLAEEIQAIERNNS